jgi:hypothetical protein
MRKTETVVIDQPGRDHGKTFVLHEMSAFQAESWAMRALLAVGAGNVQVPSPPPNSGIAGLLELGLRSIFNLPYDQARPLLEEMLGCVHYLPDPAKPDTERALDKAHDDIEEASTISFLRSEVFRLHTGFSLAGALSTLVSGVMQQYSSLITPTPPEPLAPLSADGSPA